MSVERLVAMANDIADYFRSEPDPAVGAAGVATHLRRYWTPRMRRQIFDHVDAGGGGLSALARAGVDRLREMEAAEAR
ncbi:MAG: formate dehydrogenase subunit delta [Lysobacterales bacterium]